MRGVMGWVELLTNLSYPVPEDECERGEGPCRVELLTNLSYPEEECERCEGPGRVELLTNLSSPDDECESGEGPGRVELLGRLVPDCWEQTISRPSHRITYLNTQQNITVKGKLSYYQYHAVLCESGKMNLYSATWIHILNMDLDPNNNRTLLLILYFFVIYALVDVFCQMT